MENERERGRGREKIFSKKFKENSRSFWGTVSGKSRILRNNNFLYLFLSATQKNSSLSFSLDEMMMISSTTLTTTAPNASVQVPKKVGNHFWSANDFTSRSFCCALSRAVARRSFGPILERSKRSIEFIIDIIFRVYLSYYIERGKTKTAWNDKDTR